MTDDLAPDGTAAGDPVSDGTVSGESVLVELGRIADGLGPALAPAGGEELLRAIASTAQRLFDAAACSLALLSEDESELVFTTVVGAGAEVVRGLRIPSGHGIAGWVVMSGQPIAVADLQQDPRWARDVADVTGYAPSSMLVAPVATRQRLLGVIEILDRSADRAESEQDMALLGLVADQAALAIEGARAFDNFGRQLLRAVAATTDDVDVAAALDSAAASLGEPDRDLLELASLFAQLGRTGPGTRRLAVRVLRAFVDHEADQVPRRSPRRG